MALMAFNTSASGYDPSTITSDTYSIVATSGISSVSERQSMATDDFPSSSLSVSSLYSIVEPSSTRLDDNGTYSASFTSISTSFSSQISLVSSMFTSQKPVSESYATSASSSTSSSISSSDSNMTQILPSQSNPPTGSTYRIYHSISSHSSGDSPSQLFSSPTSSFPSLMTIATISVHWNASSSESSSSTSTLQSSSSLTSSYYGQNSTMSDVPTTTPVLTETTSSSFFPSTVFSSTSLPEQLPSSTSSSSLGVSPAHSDLDYTVSTSSESLYYIYTQIYKITGSGTTFETGIPTTTMANVHSTPSFFASPKSTMTEDLDFYQKILSGGSGSSKGTTNSNNRGKIIGGVIGGVGGFLVCCLLLFLIFHRKRRQDKTKVKGFSSEIGRRAGYSFPISDEDINDEKTAIKENSAGGLLARIKDRSIPPILRRKDFEEEDPASLGDPFQNEFNFQSRTKARPPLPPPRKVVLQDPTARSNGNPDLGVINEPDSVASRDSYISSMSESSVQGDYSTMSSTSIRLGMQGHSNSVSDSSRGFFREVL